MSIGNQLAFPSNPHPESGFKGADEGGMTLRQYAAIHIAAGMAATESNAEFFPDDDLVKMAVNRADAILAELEKPCKLTEGGR